MKRPVPAPSMALFAALIALLFCAGCGHKPAQPPRAPISGTDSGTVQAFTAADFTAALADPRPVLVDFWAPWCGPCRKQGPIVEDVAKRMGDRALVGKVNVDDEKDLATRYEIRAIPTLVILKGGRVIQRFEGVRSAEDLVQALEAAK
jgi:thioredoxin 1